MIRTRRRIGTVLLITVIVMMTPDTVRANQILDGLVVGVADGDTLTILDHTKTQHRIRLAQIDAPEKSQDFGQRSKQSLSELVFGKQVRIEVVTTDQYGRLVGTVFVGGIDVNLEQVRRGMAWVYRRYARNPVYFEAEDQARHNHIGLWAQPNPVAPWEFRRTAHERHQRQHHTLMFD